MNTAALTSLRVERAVHFLPSSYFQRRQRRRVGPSAARDKLAMLVGTRAPAHLRRYTSGLTNLHLTTPGTRLPLNVNARELADVADDKECCDSRFDEEPAIVVFRRYARIVARLVGVCITLRKYAMDAGLMEQYMVSVKRTARQSSSDGSEEELTFELTDFKTKRELGVPRRIIELLEKLPEDRTDDDIVEIGHVMQRLPSFKKHSADMQRLMSKIVRYMKCGKKRVVLRKGHIGYSVYFVFAGSVHVILDHDDNDVFTKPEIIKLRQGACFGEIALVKNTRRNATIVCAEETEFIVIDKEDYVDNGLSDLVQQETKARYTFFRQWDPLASWSDDAINELSCVSRTEDFTYNRLILEDSRRNEHLYFVVKGSCDILRLVDLDQCDASRQLRGPNTSTFDFRSTLHVTSDPQPGPAVPVTSTDPPPPPPRANGVRRQFSRTTAENMLREREKEESASKKTKKGIYVLVDTLRDGQCMGLEALFAAGTDLTSQRYSMISKGCSLIHVPRKRFREMAPPDTLDSIRASLVRYPTDSALAQHFVKRSHWDDYRRHVVQSVLSAVRQAVPHIGGRDCENRAPPAPARMRGRSARAASGKKLLCSDLPRSKSLAQSAENLSMLVPVEKGKRPKITVDTRYLTEHNVETPSRSSEVKLSLLLPPATRRTKEHVTCASGESRKALRHIRLARAVNISSPARAKSAIAVTSPRLSGHAVK